MADTEKAAPAPAPALDDKATRIEAAIRNHLSNSPISRDSQAWEHLTRVLPDLVAAIMKEI